MSVSCEPWIVSTASIPWKPGRPGVDDPYTHTTVATAAVPRLRERHDVKRPTPVRIDLAEVPKLTVRERPATQPATRPATAPVEQERQQ